MSPTRQRLARLQRAAEKLNERLQGTPSFVTVSYVEDGFYLRAVFCGRPPEDLPLSAGGFRVEACNSRALRRKHRDVS
jgi:hypothetical protein